MMYVPTKELSGRPEHTAAAAAAAEAIRQLRDGPERRFVALGPDHYKAMDLGPAQLKEVEAELQRARAFEALTVTAAVRRMELDEQRRRLLEDQDRMRQRSRDRAVKEAQLRQRAAAALQREMEYLPAQRDELLAADRRAIVEREKRRVLQRRRSFETGDVAVATASSGRGLSHSSFSHHDDGGGLRTVRVIAVSIGNGREEQLAVRLNDDPRHIAAAFARKHKLPEHAVYSLQAQIKEEQQRMKKVEPSVLRSTSTPRHRTPTHHATDRRRQPNNFLPLQHDVS